MGDERPVLVWFRQDLRLADQPALSAAATSGRPVIPVFVLDDQTPDRWRAGGASRWWLHGTLAALEGALASLGSRLILKRGPSAEVLTALARETNAAAVHWNRHIEPYWRGAEDDLDCRMNEAGIEVGAHDGQLLFPPGTVQGRSGEAPRVFTPFWRACLAAAPPAVPLAVPADLRAPESWPASESLDDWRLRPSNPNWAGDIAATWTPGEAAAQERLEDFLDEGLSHYRDRRNEPGHGGTSRLSPHLHWGEISVRQVWHACRVRADGERGYAAGTDAYLRELGWREFCAVLLLSDPEMPERPLQERFANFPWRNDEAAFRAWTAGRTGYPIVDAGMRELWHTGWMHNRVRMIVASFLTKHLLQPWQGGEAWFWDTLVDADLANNSGGWQWVAGCGVDAAPYFRIFNPILQGEKFDPDGAYVRQWLPELENLDSRYIHKPWQAPPDALIAASLRIGIDYPPPIVDHGEARRRALAAFSTLKATA